MATIEQRRANERAWLDLLAEITAIANDPLSPGQALQPALEQICTVAGFAVAHLHEVDGGIAEPSGVWFAFDPAAVAPFRAESGRATREGLVGRAMRTGLPAYLEDVGADAASGGSATAATAGLGGGVAVPLLEGQRVAAVLELFADHPIRLDDEVRTLLQTVGIQLGRIFERSRAARLAREERERQRALLDASTDALFVADAGGEITDANPAACRLLGYSREELVGTKPSDFAAPEWQEVVGRSVSAKIGKEIDSSHYRYVVLDRAGNRIPVEVTSTALHDADGVVAVEALLRDLRSDQRVELALRESEERFRGAFEAAPIGMAITSPEGRWLKVNDALCAIIGYTADELLTMNFQEITHPDDLEADLALGRRVLAGELPSLQLEKRFLRKDGSDVWVHLSVSLVRAADGTPLYSVAQVLDIDERKRRELDAARLRSRHPVSGPLSPREREVLGLLAEGLTSAEVGSALGVSEETVQTHVRRAMAKLDARSRTQAVASAIRLGWLGDERPAAA